MTPLRTLLPLVALLPLALLASPSPALAAVPLPNGTFAAWNGDVHPATVTWDGPCLGWGELRVVVHDPAGAWATALWLQSGTTLEICDDATNPQGSGARCFECPPVLVPYGWTLRDPEGPATFTGAGSFVYDRYTYHRGPSEMQGFFHNGLLQWRDLGAWP